MGFAVDEFLSDGDRITGIRGRRRGSRTSVTEQATIVVGADGRNSSLARHVNAPAYESAPTLTCWYFSYWSGVPSTALELYVRDQRAIFAHPTNDDLLALFVVWPSAELPRVRGDIERSYMTAIDGVPEFAERVRTGTREERFYGATQLPNFLRKPFGAGWALVGDAGAHKNPSWRSASATPSGTRSCWPARSKRGCRAGARSRRRWRTTRRSATTRPCPTTARTSWRRS
jgi:flavin-dependent dehydrogenase